MILKWGSYAHDNNEVWFDLKKHPMYADIGTRIGWTELWTIWGVLIGTDHANLLTKMTALQNAYAVNRLNLVFYHDDGTTPTGHGVNDADTIGGTRVVDFSWLDTRHDELVLRRSYQIVVQADLYDTDDEILSWHESIQRIGDGLAIEKWLWTLTGPPVQQTVQQFSTFKYIQSGEAVGKTAYPLAATPLWPANLHKEESLVAVETPTYRDGDTTKYPIHWRYVFENAAALTPFVPSTFP